MGKQTKIQWTDHTVNFWWGCLKVSPGCTHCYAETFSKRVGKDIWGPAATTERSRTKGPWKDVVKWNYEAQSDGIRRRVFCQSMSDTFEDHPQLTPWREEALALMESLAWLDFQVLTKRPENVASMVPAHWMKAEMQLDWPNREHWRFRGNGTWAGWPSNVWIGTSVENQATADERIPVLLKLPAPVRFLSCEPLLEQVELYRYLYPKFAADDPRHYSHRNGVEWAIVGGESGPGARPMTAGMALKLIVQCETAGVPVFMKQMGSVLAKEMHLQDAKGGDPNEWSKDYRIRQFPPTGQEQYGIA